MRFNNNYNTILILPFNVAILYTYVLAILFFLGKGDDYIHGIIILILNISVSLISYIFRGNIITEININKIDDKIKFVYYKKKKKYQSEFSLKNLTIDAKIITRIDYYNARKIQCIDIFFKVTQNNNETFITNYDLDVDEAFKMIKYLRSLEGFSYSVDYDTLTSPVGSMSLCKAVKEYLNDNIYDKAALKYYERKICNIIIIIGISIISFLDIGLFTAIYLDSIGI